jgi:Ca2+/H+ antiporter, TMEM165/GDT1 family
MSKKKWMIIAPLAILAIPVFIAIGGELVMHLWNWLLPPLFGWRQVTFWQALGLLALCRILFGSWGGHGSDRSPVRRRMKERMDERWERMTPEEREKFRQSLRGRCSPFEPPDAKPAP